ncbi:MAG: hypothetical protein KIT87_25525 [Anaerolineae bacterium]|nr:hypothetical protein [Anaerolineae bacterium]
MGWETRQGHQYYYRARKVNGRVIRDYLGAGPAAQLAADQDAEAHQRRQAQRQADHEERQRLDALATSIAELDHAIEDLVHATLILAGYHRHHRGAWRKRREQPPTHHEPHPTGTTLRHPPPPGRRGR